MPTLRCTPCATLHSSCAALQLDHLAASVPALHLTSADEPTTCAYLQKGPVALSYMLMKNWLDTALLTFVALLLAFQLCFCSTTHSVSTVGHLLLCIVLHTFLCCSRVPRDAQPITSPLCWPVLSCSVSYKLATSKMTPK